MKSQATVNIQESESWRDHSLQNISPAVKQTVPQGANLTNISTGISEFWKPDSVGMEPKNETFIYTIGLIML